jgi:GcrA cell cycle regulator
MVTCCWPLGEPGTYASAFCKSGKPYCPDHVKLAYLKVRNRREDAA